MAVAGKTEVFRRFFSYCDFVNPKGLNFMARALVFNIERVVNPDILKCPFKKGVFKAYEFIEDNGYTKLPAPPFLSLGQRFEVSLIIRTVIDKRKEMLCSAFIHYVIEK